MKSKLAQIADDTRPVMLEKNFYNENKKYDSNHPNANQQVDSSDPNNIRGKGTGIKFDFENGGSSIDIYGDPNISNTGRIAIRQNLYTADNKYTVTI